MKKGKLETKNASNAALPQMKDPGSGDPNFMTSLARGLAILRECAAETVRITSIGLNKGSRLPAYCTSMGRVLLADLPTETIAGYLERTALRPRTEFTETDPERFRLLLAKVRSDRYALNDQELSASFPKATRNQFVV